MRRPTISDVAKAAGVGRSTVSRALSGSGYVSDAARDRVREGAERLGYVPDNIARSLRSRSHLSIGLIISDITNAFSAEVATGVEEILAERGYRMLISSSRGDPAEELEQIRLLHGWRVPGVILTPVSTKPSAAEYLQRVGMAVVEVDRRMSRGKGDAVLLENELGAYQATEHLIKLGHRHIAVLSGDNGLTTDAERLTGYRRALQEHGLEFSKRLVTTSTVSTDQAARATTELLTAHPEVTAMFATNNVLAEGALVACRQLGFSLPRDLSLVAFDDVLWMSLVEPPLTTVSQPTREIGRSAASLLLDRLEGRRPAGAIIRRLAPRFIVRSSTGPPR